ncbi:MAG: phosphoglycerate kinase [Desulfamplus sp.]|nr:phosphoglycerate kinase [Desulfamplus sp.]
MKSVKDIKVSAKRVMVRVDYNLPMDENLNITDDNRIRETLPLINYLLENNAKIILISHMGRPKGKVVPALSLKPAATRLSELLLKRNAKVEGDVKMQTVNFISDCIGGEVEKKVSELKDGEILLLENLRFHEGEKTSDPDFVKQLASLCDVYVNDAFAVSHRKEASVTALPMMVKESVAGFLLEKELQCYSDAIKNPVRPLVAIIGGAKVSSKLAALQNMLNCVDTLIIGGAMANTFLKSQGIDVGASMVEEELVETASKIIKEAKEKGVRLQLPIDLVFASKFDKDAEKMTIDIGGKDDSQTTPTEGWMALDIGEKSAKMFADLIAGAKTIVWNGPMGVFEMERFCNGTRAISKTIAESGAFSVVGGGDTGLAAKVCGVENKVSYISTGGGAFLHLMEGKELPAVVALENGKF